MQDAHGTLLLRLLLLLYRRRSALGAFMFWYLKLAESTYGLQPFQYCIRNQFKNNHPSTNTEHAIFMRGKQFQMISNIHTPTSEQLRWHLL